LPAAEPTLQMAPGFRRILPGRAEGGGLTHAVVVEAGAAVARGFGLS